ncbi:unnamed protein product [Cuscuta campestris]|uniref:Uncharacterized protein n=1 Tax=Cuscuta campestris TaxID=132261 RepID=A0A484LK08_9ASTE|nr:unnamed protein product [Cuscuta campestris]
MPNAQPPLALPHQNSHLQPQPSGHPPQPSQPVVPIAQHQNPLQAPHALTGHQSYPQIQHQTPVGSVASGSFPSAHTQNQAMQQQPMMRPPPAPSSNQQHGMLPPQGQFVSHQSIHHSNSQYPSLPVQSHLPQATQQPVSQQYPQHPFSGPYPSQSQQHGPSLQQPSHIHHSGPQHMALQTSHAPVQSQPNAALGPGPVPGMNPQPPQNYFGRAVPLAPSGSGAAPPVLTVQHGLNQPPVSQIYSNSVNNQLQVSIDQKKSVALEGQVVPSSAKPEHTAEATIISQNNADKDSSVIGTESFETKVAKMETGPGNKQDSMKECAKSDQADKGNSNDPVLMQTVKEERSENALAQSSGAKSADTEGVIERASSGRVPDHFHQHRSFEVQSNTSQGFPSSALPFGSVGIRDGMGGAQPSGPKGHFVPHHAPVNVSENHFGQQYPANKLEAEMFHKRRMSGFDRGLPHHKESSHGERLKMSVPDHSGTLSAEPHWPHDQAGLGPFDKGPGGFGYDGNAVAPSRLLPSYRPPGAPYINDGAERVVRHSLLNGERRNADFQHRHTDFPGPGFGRGHMDHFAPRSPPREYFGMPPHGYLPHGHAGFDDMDGRGPHMFPGGSRPFRHPSNPVRDSFHDDRFLPLHRHPRGDLVDEHIRAGHPHNFRGEVFGNDLPNHLRGADPLGRRNMHAGEPVGFGPFAGPGSLPRIPFGESFGGNKTAFPRPGEPGFRSRYSLQGVSNERTHMER